MRGGGILIVTTLSLGVLVTYSIPATAAPSGTGATSETATIQRALSIVRTVRMVRRALRERRPGWYAPRAMVEDQVWEALRALPDDEPWPEGPLLRASAAESGATLVYGAACVDAAGRKAPLCVHELRLRFRRDDGRLRLWEMSAFGW